jgi:hypothetical protein
MDVDDGVGLSVEGSDGSLLGVEGIVLSLQTCGLGLAQTLLLNLKGGLGIRIRSHGGGGVVWTTAQEQHVGRAGDRIGDRAWRLDQRQERAIGSATTRIAEAMVTIVTTCDTMKA